MTSRSVNEFKEDLERLIVSDPSRAWELLRKEPLAVVAFSQIRSQYEISESLRSNSHYNTFFSEYRRNVAHLYDLTHIIAKDGYALTVEYLNEIWRMQQQTSDINSFNQQLLHNLTEIETEIENFSENNEFDDLLRMINFSKDRIIGFQSHEAKRMNDHLIVLQPFFQKIIEQQFLNPPSTEIPRTWIALLSLCTSSIHGLREFRKSIAGILYEKSKSIFPDLEEKHKFELAPWLLALEKTIE